jgi:hypothetical protein
MGAAVDALFTRQSAAATQVAPGEDTLDDSLVTDDRKAAHAALHHRRCGLVSRVVLADAQRWRTHAAGNRVRLLGLREIAETGHAHELTISNDQQVVDVVRVGELSRLGRGGARLDENGPFRHEV